MWFRCVFDNLKSRFTMPVQRARTAPARSRPAERRLAIDSLEDRCLLCFDPMVQPLASFEASQVNVVRSNADATSAATMNDSAKRLEHSGLAGQRALQQGATAPSISIGDVSLSEAQEGNTAFNFTVVLSAASSKEVSVRIATMDGTATTADNDYVHTSRKLVFAPGETTKTVTVSVSGDAKPESDETFFVNLSRARNAVISDAQGVGTILDDDPPPPPPPPVHEICTPSTPCGVPESVPGSGYYDWGIGEFVSGW